MINISKYLESIYKKNTDGIFLSKNSEDFSSSNKNSDSEFIESLIENDCRTAIKLFMPNLEEMIFSSKIEASLELFNHNKPGICIDYGSVWGTLSIGMAKRGHQVIAIDKKNEHLNFLKSRTLEEKLENIYLVKDDLNDIKFKRIADYAILNGVIELLTKNFKKSKELQVSFLKKIYESINLNGQLLIGVNNKFSYRYLIEKSDSLTSSFNELKSLLKLAGFKQIEDYCCFPSHHSPSLIVPNSKNGIKEYEIYEDKNIVSWKQKLMFKYLEIFLMKYLKANKFCPSIIIIATK